MFTALREICALRGSTTVPVNPNNRNRYCILTNETIGTTAYCFSTPIYTSATKGLVCRKFVMSDNSYEFTGSNAHVFVRNGTLVLTNKEGQISINLPCNEFHLEDGVLFADGIRIRPTFNGVSVWANMPSMEFKIYSKQTYSSTRCNGKFWGLMQEKFKPFFTISTLVSYDKGEEILPVHVRDRQLDDFTYSVTVFTETGDCVAFEANLYEHKLFQDTTVESKNSGQNNAFGGTAFIGNSKWFGEQWLYLRPDFSKIPQLYCVPVRRVLLHIPCLRRANQRFSVYPLKTRFCSFGSNWSNKKDYIPQKVTPVDNGDYVTVDMTDLFTDSSEQRLSYTEGFILKPAKCDNDYDVISTGDNYDLPMILEIQYTERSF